MSLKSAPDIPDIFCITEDSKNLIGQVIRENHSPAILITGTDNLDKYNTVLDVVVDSLYNTQLQHQKSHQDIYSIIKENLHPDVYIFDRSQVKIGKSSDPSPLTIRHLLRHFIPYSARESSRRFIIFPDASAIMDEAESALLKVLEEPPPATTFLLLAQDASGMKDTIVSRCMEIPVRYYLEKDSLAPDAWTRFWQYSQLCNTPDFEFFRSKGWIDTIQSRYDELAFDLSDYIIFEDIGWNQMRKKFQKETVHIQSQAMQTAFLPVYYSLRDAVTAGKTFSIGPFNIPPGKLQDNFSSGIEMIRVLQKFFRHLNVRYFGTRPPSLQIVFFDFMSSWMELWESLKSH